MTATVDDDLKNPYAIFGVPPDCGAEELKKRYQQLLLRFHPDKASALGPNPAGRTSSSLEDAPLSPEEKFHRLETCWKSLRDPESRRAYDDASRQRDRLQSHPVDDRMALSEMESEASEDGETTWFHPCRCGGEYAIGSDDEQYRESRPSEEILLCCSDCSLAILVRI